MIDNTTALGSKRLRQSLPRRPGPYWHCIAKGLAIGYRRGKKPAGTWIARYYDKVAGRSFLPLGAADDVLQADGLRTLSFKQAVQLGQASWPGSKNHSDAIPRSRRRARSKSEASLTTETPRVKDRQAAPRILSKEEVERLIAVSDRNFARIARSSFDNGFRYSELCEMTCAAYASDTGSVLVSSLGRTRRVVLAAETKLLFDELTRERAPEARVFQRTDGSAWLKGHQHRRMREACRRTGIPTASFDSLRLSHAVWLLENGVPLERVGAKLGARVPSLRQQIEGHRPDLIAAHDHLDELRLRMALDSMPKLFPTTPILTAVASSEA